MTDMQITADPGVPSVVITSEFDAPRELVYRAHIEPELLVHWLGPRRLTMTVDHQEVRDGGRWPEVTVRTFEYEGAPGHVSFETLTLEERDGKTLARTVSVFQSVEDRDTMVQNGMEKGVREGTERLEELLARLTAAG